MKISGNEKVVIFGAGNVANHLGSALKTAGVTILQVINRTAAKGEALAEALHAGYGSELTDADPEADLYILAVTDNAIPELAGRLRLGSKMVVHTSGFCEMNLLQQVSSNFGVFYPLQTFSVNQNVDFSSVPVCLECNSLQGLEFLTSLAERISRNTRVLSSEQRRLAHLAAVFSCNFPNFMYVVGEELLKESGIGADILLPLIRQTGDINIHEHLFARQTGPARRGDSQVMKGHQALLADHPDYLRIYNLISESIIKYQKEHGEL